MPKCRGCGAQIEFIKSKAGRAIPVDLKPIVIKRFSKDADTIIVTKEGEVFNGKKVGELRNVDDFKNTDGYAVGYISHFATCPNADKFRK